eukprot:NODE_5428_length_578_cov_41.162571_g4710_i0.p2 GENE.NODE_5428_length_578_cov_41.162571_g4710_i0~~NODE_5428_length_578_cov_41.162571_g4710_i0.p2  ORF type:complete len:67 (+),score=1.51 NODE_5428_length_578_cov_41.162571_g4710_i0:206-406(+)
MRATFLDTIHRGGVHPTMDAPRSGDKAPRVTFCPLNPIQPNPPSLVFATVLHALVLVNSLGFWWRW